MLNITEYLREKKTLVDRHLDRLVPAAEEYPPVLQQAMRYSLFAGGKRIRPILALATGEALEGEFDRVIRLACALECIHTYSLIHDDLPAMDDDDFRRGNPTCHKKFGEGIAILAGNGLMTVAFQVLTEIPSASPGAETVLAVINRLCRAIGPQGGVIAGQVVDLTTAGKPFTEEELLYIHSSKTGALIEASVSCAAMLSEATPDELERLKTFGLKIGLAFQVVDDILDVVETSERLGKTPGKDTAEKKATYTALYGLERSREIAEQLVEEGIQSISFLGSAGEALEELARFISVRRF